MYSVGVVVGVVGGGRQSLNLRDRPRVLRLEAQTNRIRTVEKKLGGVPRLHRLHFELAGSFYCRKEARHTAGYSGYMKSTSETEAVGSRREIGIATPRERRSVSSNSDGYQSSVLKKATARKA